jgi:hypothetical protein
MDPLMMVKMAILKIVWAFSLIQMLQQIKEARLNKSKSVTLQQRGLHL